MQGKEVREMELTYTRKKAPAAKRVAPGCCPKGSKGPGY